LAGRSTCKELLWLEVANVLVLGYCHWKVSLAGRSTCKELQWLEVANVLVLGYCHWKVSLAGRSTCKVLLWLEVVAPSANVKKFVAASVCRHTFGW
jgi:hypothetical protein